MKPDEYRTEDCIIQVSPDKQFALAWVNSGAYQWFIKKNELDMYRFDPRRALYHMKHLIQKGTYRCSRCGWEGPRSEFVASSNKLLCVACMKPDGE